MKIAKIFKHGNGQAVRLPNEVAPKRVMAAVGQFKGTFERRQPKDQKRNWR